MRYRRRTHAKLRAGAERLLRTSVIHRSQAQAACQIRLSQGQQRPRWMRRDGGDLTGCRQARDAWLGCGPTEREASLFGCSDQQRWGWNASQIIGPVVELKCYGLVEEKHSISPQQLNRQFGRLVVASELLLRTNRSPGNHLRFRESCAICGKSDAIRQHDTNRRCFVTF